MTKIIKLITYDLRFPTSDHLDGSDAMNPDPVSYTHLRAHETG